MRGGQITLFFIVGVVLLFTVALLYLFVQRNQVAQPLDVDNAQLNAYLASCIDTAVENELLDLGEHAGIQERVRSSFPSLEGHFYGIKRKEPDQMIGPWAHPIPQYPNWSITLANTELNDDGVTPLYPYQDGYFGDVHFMAPCSRASGNAPGSQFACRYYPGLPAGTPSGKSAQELAEAALQVKAQGCVNQGLFQRTFGSDVRVQDPRLNLTLTPQLVLASVDFPLTVNGQAHELHLERMYALRYRALAEFSYDLARKETRDVHFNIIDPADYKTLSSYKEGFKVERIQGTAADLIIINDTASRVRNNPYAFQFLIEHRNPMIDPSSTDCSNLAAADPDSTPLQCTMQNGIIYIKNEYGLTDCLRPGTTDVISCDYPTS
jgi:hypothetical protein